MEAGAARFFTADDIAIHPEPALAEGFDKIEAPGLDQHDSDLAAIEQQLTEAHDFLTGVAEDFLTNINGVQVVLDGELFPADPAFFAGILADRQFTQDAIDGAESSFSADAYTQNPPWYTPPPDTTGSDQSPPPDQQETP